MSAIETEHTYRFAAFASGGTGGALAAVAWTAHTTAGFLLLLLLGLAGLMASIAFTELACREAASTRDITGLQPGDRLDSHGYRYRVVSIVTKGWIEDAATIQIELQQDLGKNKRFYE